MIAPLFLIASCLSAQVLRTDLQLAKVVQDLRAEVNGNEALEYVTRIYENDRWQTFPRFQKTARYLRETMNAIGLRRVELVSVPADGVTQFGFWTMPLAWDVRRARLEIVEPAAPPGVRVLADYSQEPASLVMWSGSTPPGGITADVVELRPATMDALRRIEVKGRMVLADPPMDLSRRGALKAALYRRGAAGMISYATENPDLPDGHYWINAWGDHGWGFTKTSSPLVGFSITPRQAAYLREQLALGRNVRVKAVADTSYYAGDYPYVTGLIEGEGSDEEVLELGHAYEFAQDNATGVAAMLEAMAALDRLIRAKALPRPRRSIRILAMAEDYGSSAYIATNAERIKRTIGALCIDTPAGPYGETGGYTFALNPDVSRSFQDALMVRLAESYYAAIPGRFPRWSPYRPTTDSFLSDPAIGVPTIAIKGSSGLTNVHHNSADTLDKVDPRSLRDLASIVAAFLYYLASAGEGEIPWLAEITADRGYENAVRAASPYLNRIATAADAATIGRELHAGLAKIAYEGDREREALLSLLRLVQPAKAMQIRSALGPWLDGVRQFAAIGRERLQRAADRRAGEIGAGVSVPPVGPAAGRSGADAARMIVRRTRFGPVTLDDLPLEQREGFPGFAGIPAPLPLLTWCDGKRSLAEVIRLIELEQGPLDFDIVAYFRFLAKHGYVEIFLRDR